MTPRPCPLCTGRAGDESFPFRTSVAGEVFSYLRCSDCGAVFVDPVPSPDLLRSTYDWDRYHVQEWDGTEAARYEATAAALTDLRPPPGTVLDFGCGAGGFLRAAAAAGYDVRGAEVNADVAAKAAASVGCRVDVLDDLLAEGAAFDVVVLRDVLPHLVDPAADLRTIERLLAPDGVLFFDGPLEEGPSIVRAVAGAAATVKRRFRGAQPSSFEPTMLYRASARAQRRFFLDRMGYRELHLEIYETGWPYHVPGRRPASLGIAAKEAVAAVARAAAAVAPLGNRFRGLYRP